MTPSSSDKTPISNRWRVSALAAVPAIALTYAALRPPSSSTATNDLLNVVATTGQVGDLARNVGGDTVSVSTLMGPGVDPHLFKASESDVIDLIDSDLILYSGLHLEGNLAEVLEQAGKRQPVAAVSAGIPEEELIQPLDNAFDGNPDPHFWFDPILWRDAAEEAARAFANADPGNAAAYGSAAETYGNELIELDQWAAEQFSRIPEASRILVTAHDAFGYLGRRYGLDVVGLQGISTATEAGVRDVQNIADLIATNEIRAVFVETSVPRRTIEAVQVAVADRGWRVEIGTSLYSDAMGDEGTPEGTYIGMMRHNVNAIVSGLTGEPSE
jgi:manganese/zinc/iron transport system substrate-binding protein